MTGTVSPARARRRRYAIRAALVVGTAAFLVVIGVSPLFAVASAALVFGATLAWTGLPLDSSAAARVRRQALPGTRSDLARLATDLRGADARSEVALRMRELARRRLTRTGEDPRGSQLRALVDGDERRISVTAVAVVLDELDRLPDPRGRRTS